MAAALLGIIFLGSVGSTNARVTNSYGYSSVLMMRYLKFIILYMYMLVF